LERRFLRFEVKPVPVDREEQYDDAFINNFNREDLTLLDTVLSVEQLLKNGRSKEDIARMAGKTLGWVDQYVILARMHPDVRPLMEELNNGQRSDKDGRKLRRKTMLQEPKSTESWSKEDKSRASGRQNYPELLQVERMSWVFPWKDAQE
jgi:hypothetical protein